MAVLHHPKLPSSSPPPLQPPRDDLSADVGKTRSHQWTFLVPPAVHCLRRIGDPWQSTIHPPGQMAPREPFSCHMKRSSRSILTKLSVVGILLVIHLSGLRLCAAEGYHALVSAGISGNVGSANTNHYKVLQDVHAAPRYRPPLQQQQQQPQRQQMAAPFKMQSPFRNGGGGGGGQTPVFGRFNNRVANRMNKIRYDRLPPPPSSAQSFGSSSSSSSVGSLGSLGSQSVASEAPIAPPPPPPQPLVDPAVAQQLAQIQEQNRLLAEQNQHLQMQQMQPPIPPPVDPALQQPLAMANQQAPHLAGVDIKATFAGQEIQSVSSMEDGGVFSFSNLFGDQPKREGGYGGSADGAPQTPYKQQCTQQEMGVLLKFIAEELKLYQQDVARRNQAAAAGRLRR